MTPTIRKILLPTDFGPCSERAAAYAGSLAKGFGASVHLVHVLEKPFAVRKAARPPDGTGGDQRYHESRAKLAAFAAATLQHTADRITIEVRTGTPWKAIVDAAVDYGADLIVMSAPGHGGVPNLVMGTVAERVSGAAPCPVLAVRESGAARFPARTRAA